MTIKPAPEVLVIFELRVKPGHLEAVLAVYEQNGILELPRTINGYRGAEMWTDEQRSALVVTSRWSGADAYDRWLADPRRAAGGVEVLDHIEIGPEATRTTILHRAAPPAATPTP